MKIRIYNQPSGGTIGGSEVAAAVGAAALADEHDVELLHHRSTLTRETLASFAAVDLTRVHLQLLLPWQGYKGPAWQVFTRLSKEKEEEKRLSDGCDVFVAFVHEPPPFCFAAKGVLWVLFPFHPINDPNLLKRSWYRYKLQARIRGYQLRHAISEFSADWSRRRWNIETEVLYPPVDVETAMVCEKSNTIISVGRFTETGHGKKQIEMLKAYGAIRNSNTAGWEYLCVGACGPAPADVAFFTEAQSIAKTNGARLIANIRRDELVQSYGTSKIYWHAAGLDVDETREPERAEHFGISTVEAMAAGCVPVVINKGGQREIVEHGVSGFLWSTLEELQEFTLQLMNDEALRGRMSAAARVRAQMFSRQNFVKGFRALINGSAEATGLSSSPVTAMVATNGS